MKTRKDSSLNDIERDTLRAVAKAMIPSCKSRDLPGADDDVIFDDILISLGRDTATVADIVSKLYLQTQGDLDQLASISPGSILFEFSTKDRINAAILERVIAQCYYRNDRVMKSIDIEPRPPYPNGYTLVSTDRSLLEPVRARGKIYRDV